MQHLDRDTFDSTQEVGANPFRAFAFISEEFEGQSTGGEASDLSL
jgi:hypothetical protein